MDIRADAKARAQNYTNLRTGFDFLTGQGIVDRSGGKIQPLSPQAASAMLGNWTVETGSPNLIELDVVERGNNQAGRGMSQYTDSRRGPYDVARQQAIDAGQDPNSMDFQLGYFVDEYLGKHDHHAGGNSLIGWTGALDKYGQSDNVTEAADNFRQSYFRPDASKAHPQRRRDAAVRIYDMFGGSGNNFVNNAQNATFGGVRVGDVPVNVTTPTIEAR